MSCSGKGGSRGRDRKHLNSVGYSRDIQEKIINILGGKCSRCGFEDRRTLHTHHVFGGGALERKVLSARRYKLYNLIVKSRREGVSKYELLCANCHVIETFRNKIISPDWSIQRDYLISILGGKCVRCFITTNRVLQFDHINGDGSILDSYEPREILRQINQGLIQLLCANCNWIKRAENKEY